MFKQKTLPLQISSPCKAIMSPCEAKQYVRTSEVREIRTSKFKSCISPLRSPESRMERMMEENHRLMDQNMRLVDEVMQLKDSFRGNVVVSSDMRLKVMLSENQKLTEVIANMQKDYQSQKRIINDLNIRLRDLRKSQDSENKLAMVKEESVKHKQQLQEIIQRLELEIKELHQARRAMEAQYQKTNAQANSSQLQMQILYAQLEKSQGVITYQQQEIENLEQRMAQQAQEYSHKESVLLQEREQLIQRLTQLEDQPLRDRDGNNQTSVNQSLVDSPFKIFKLQNFYALDYSARENASPQSALPTSFK